MQRLCLKPKSFFCTYNILRLLCHWRFLVLLCRPLLALTRHLPSALPDLLAAALKEVFDES